MILQCVQKIFHGAAAENGYGPATGKSLMFLIDANTFNGLFGPEFSDHENQCFIKTNYIERIDFGLEPNEEDRNIKTT